MNVLHRDRYSHQVVEILTGIEIWKMGKSDNYIHTCDPIWDLVPLGVNVYFVVDILDLPRSLICPIVHNVK